MNQAGNVYYCLGDYNKYLVKQELTNLINVRLIQGRATRQNRSGTTMAK